MSRRLISRISRCRRSQSPKEPTSADPPSQGNGRDGRLAPPAASAGAVSGLRGGNLSCLGTLFDTRRVTLRGALAGVKSAIFLLPDDDLSHHAKPVVEGRFRGD